MLKLPSHEADLTSADRTALRQLGLRDQGIETDLYGLYRAAQDPTTPRAERRLLMKLLEGCGVQLMKHDRP